MNITFKFWFIVWMVWITFLVKVSLFISVKVQPAAREVGPQSRRAGVTSANNQDKSMTSTHHISGAGGERCPDGQPLEIRFPDAILIGNRKAGTHAIVRFLRMLNPLIRYPLKGEPHYFDRNTTFKKGMDYYKKLMPLVCPDIIIIEKTPDYFLHSYVPQRIYDWNKDVKLLLSLRDPIERSLSDYNEFRRLVSESKLRINNHEYLQSSFEAMSINKDGSINEKFPSLRSSLSDVNLQNWLEYFPLKQIHIIDADALTYRNPAKELAKIEAFLDVVPTVTEEDFQYNSSKGFYCLRSRGCLYKGHSYPRIRISVYERLVEFFRPHVIALEKMIGQKLSWMDVYLE